MGFWKHDGIMSMKAVQGDFDAVIIGSGPNGLSAAITLAMAGARVCLLEGKQDLGGGMRTQSLTLPGFQHDVCSAVHPMGILSPFLKTLPLHEHGLEWVHPKASVAHPLDGQPAVMLWRDLEKTCQGLGGDGDAYGRMLKPFLRDPDSLLSDLMGPLSWPKSPLTMLRFGLLAIRSATGLANGRFRGERAKALFAGCAGHAIMPLEHRLTAALGLIFTLTGHLTDWPVVRGGTATLAHAMHGYFTALGGTTILNSMVTKAADLPAARVYLFDTSPAQLAAINKDALPGRYVQALQRYRYGPGVFKIDWALSQSIPWSDPNCGLASTIHLGGTMSEIAHAEREMWSGGHPEKPFVLLCQQSVMDSTRAPSGQHTGYAYCHVPANSTVDLTGAIEAQVERFAPGFRDTILARHVMNTQSFVRHNPNYFGGAITGGVADLGQLFTRPVARLNPYSTPHPRIFICSASTPPGGGVHGMCGYHAARRVLKRLHRHAIEPLA